MNTCGEKLDLYRNHRVRGPVLNPGNHHANLQVNTLLPTPVALLQNVGTPFNHHCPLVATINGQSHSLLNLFMRLLVDLRDSTTAFGMCIVELVWAETASGKPTISANFRNRCSISWREFHMCGERRMNPSRSETKTGTGGSASALTISSAAGMPAAGHNPTIFGA